jgi:pimeloyl-ACP methyl ester carboxylesterase
LAAANLRENNRERLSEEIENTKKEALKTPLQTIIASLEGMKMRADREVLLHLTPYPKMLILGEKDPVLGYEETKEQITNTEVELVSFPDGHMSQIENQEELIEVLARFFKKT